MEDSASTKPVPRHTKLRIVLVAILVILVILLGVGMLPLFHWKYGGKVVRRSTSPDGAYELEIHQLEEQITGTTRVPYVLRLDLRKNGRMIKSGTFDIVCDGPADWSYELFVDWSEDGVTVSGLGIGEPKAMFVGYDGSVTVIMSDGSAIQVPE